MDWLRNSSSEVTVRSEAVPPSIVTFAQQRNDLFRGDFSEITLYEEFYDILSVFGYLVRGGVCDFN